MSSPSVPKIDIIIPCFNLYSILPRTIESLLRELKHNPQLACHVHLVDDASTDDTNNVIIDFAKQYPKQLFAHAHEHNLGHRAARATGFKHSKGQFVFFMDADDEMLEGALKSMDKALNHTPNADIILAYHRSRSSQGIEKTVALEPLPHSLTKRFKFWMEGRCHPPNGSALMRREALIKMGYPAPVNGHYTDSELLMLHLMLTADASLVKDSWVCLHKRTDSMRNTTPVSIDYIEQQVNAVFDSHLLPAQLQHLRNRYSAERAMSLFNRCLKRGNENIAKAALKQAVHTDATILLRWYHLRRVIAFGLGLKSRKQAPKT